MRTRSQAALDKLRASLGECYLFDFKKDWCLVRDGFTSDVYRRQVWKDLKDYAGMRGWKAYAHKQYRDFTLPSDFDSCDWRCAVKELPFHRHVVHGACHWLVNANLMVAKMSFPERQWCIISSDSHSTVWDGERCLFDPNAFALYPDVEKLGKMLFESGEPPCALRQVVCDNRPYNWISN